MTTPNLQDSMFASYAPATTGAAAQSRSLTTSDTSVDLVKGTYELHLDASAGMAMLRLDDAPTLPSDGSATARNGFWLAPFAPKALILQANATLHGLMTAGTGTLYITRLR